MRSDDITGATWLTELAPGFPSAGTEGFLAWDATAAGAIARLGFDFLTVDDFLTEAGFDPWSIADEAEALRACRTTDAGPSRGLRWALSASLDDQSEESLLWAELITANRLREALTAVGVTEVVVSSGQNSQQQIVQSILDASPDLRVTTARPLEPEPTDEPRSVPTIHQSFATRAARALLSVVEQVLFAITTLRVRLQCHRPLLAIALPRRELDRSRPILQSLSDAHDGSVVILPAVESRATLEMVRAIADFPVIPPPLRTYGLLDEASRVGQEITASIQRMDIGDLSVVRPQVVDAFRGTALESARRVSTRRRLHRGLRMMRPEVAVTAVVDRESWRLTAVAHASGARVVTIPHGVVLLKPPLLPDVAGAVTNLSGVIDPAVHPSTFTYWDGCLHEREYPMRSRRGFGTAVPDGQHKVLVLSDTFFGEPFLRPHLERLEVIRSVAERLQGSHLFVWKPHPGLQDTAAPFLTSDSDRGNVHILERDVDLHEQLADTAVVIAVDAAGSALVHAARMGIPIIRCWSTPRHEQAKRSPRSWHRFWADRTASASSEDELAQALLRMHNDPGHWREMGRASREIAEELTPSSGSVDIRDLLARLSRRPREP